MDSIYVITAYELIKESVVEIETTMENPKNLKAEDVNEMRTRAFELRSQILNWNEQNPFIGLDKLADRINEVIEKTNLYSFQNSLKVLSEAVLKTANDDVAQNCTEDIER